MVDMDALKAEVRQLMQQRQVIETEIDQRSARLNAPGQPGVSGSLVDREGYPIAGVDLLAVRTDRQRIIVLSNDHKQLTNQIETLLHRLHAAARESGPATPPQPAPSGVAPALANGVPSAAAQAQAPSASARTANGLGPSATQPPSSGSLPNGTASGTQAPPSASAMPSPRPFALVDEVTAASPAEAAGVQLGDQLCRFGDVAGGAGGELAAMASFVSANEGRPVEALVLRQGSPLSLTLTPNRWAGRGLLGCHLRPL